MSGVSEEDACTEVDGEAFSGDSKSLVIEIIDGISVTISISAEDITGVG